MENKYYKYLFCNTNFNFEWRKFVNIREFFPQKAKQENTNK